MNAYPMSPAQIRREGLAALIERLGPGGALSFVRQCGVSVGDYTLDRADLLRDMTLEDILAEARRTERRSPDSS